MANVTDRSLTAPSSSLHNEDQSPALGASEDIARVMSDRLRARRKALHLSQLELAQAAGVSLGSLKRFEHDALVSLDSFIRIAAALGLQAELAALFTADPEDAARRSASIQEMIAESHQLLDQIATMA